MKRDESMLIFGWGVKDVDYPVYKTITLPDGKRKVIWTCPYYVKWCGVLERALSYNFKIKNPTYTGCTVCEDWKYLSNFIKWVDSQPNRNWQNCEPDKDFLIEGNKHYSPENVVFITKKLNSFYVGCSEKDGSLVGATWDKRKKKFAAKINNPFQNKRVWLGYFTSPLEAHLVWKAKKHEYACKLAELQEDPRVAEALRSKYV